MSDLPGPSGDRHPDAFPALKGWASSFAPAGLWKEKAVFAHRVGGYRLTTRRTRRWASVQSSALSEVTDKTLTLSADDGA